MLPLALVHTRVQALTKVLALMQMLAPAQTDAGCTCGTGAGTPTGAGIGAHAGTGVEEGVALIQMPVAHTGAGVDAHAGAGIEEALAPAPDTDAGVGVAAQGVHALVLAQRRLDVGTACRPAAGRAPGVDVDTALTSPGVGAVAAGVGAGLAGIRGIGVGTAAVGVAGRWGVGVGLAFTQPLAQRWRRWWATHPAVFALPFPIVRPTPSYLKKCPSFSDDVALRRSREGGVLEWRA